jgi:hypothetical protein
MICSVKNGIKDLQGLVIITKEIIPRWISAGSLQEVITIRFIHPQTPKSDYQCFKLSMTGFILM